jgi:hypothetical protein
VAIRDRLAVLVQQQELYIGSRIAYRKVRTLDNALSVHKELAGNPSLRCPEPVDQNTGRRKVFPKQFEIDPRCLIAFQADKPHGREIPLAIEKASEQGRNRMVYRDFLTIYPLRKIRWSCALDVKRANSAAVQEGAEETRYRATEATRL